MARKLLLLVFFVSILSCRATRNASHKCYRNTKTLLSAYSMGKMIDSYFKLKKGNYFKCYKRVLGLTKVIEYKGSYTQINDTLLLSFCGDTIPKGFTRKAFIDKAQQRIVLFETIPTADHYYGIVWDKR